MERESLIGLGFTATEIAARFQRETGISLPPTYVGMAARALRLPYSESPPVTIPGHPGVLVGPVRHYAVADVPRIFAHLRQLAEGRIRHGGRSPRGTAARHEAAGGRRGAPGQGTLPF